MASTTGSLLGNFAPAMAEPYQIETSLATELGRNNPGMAQMLLGQYGLERSIREGDYANRMADQMEFGKQQLHQQMVNNLIEHAGELNKNNMMEAFAPVFQHEVPGLNIPGLQDAINLARGSTLATTASNAGKGYNQFVQGGLTPGTGAMTNMTGLPFSETGPLSLRVQEAKGARDGGSGKGDVKIVDQQSSTGQPAGRTITYSGATARGMLGGSSLPPAAGGGGGTGPQAPPRKIAPPQPNQKRSELSPDDAKKMAMIIDSTKNNNPTVHADIAAGSQNGVPNIQLDPMGNMYALGASGTHHPVGNVSSLNADDTSDDGSATV